MRHFKEHLILEGGTIKEALAQLNKLASDAILFVVDENQRLLGSLTDGDVRRGLLRELRITDKVELFIQSDPRYITKGSYDIRDVIAMREKKLKVIPVVDDNKAIVQVINFGHFKSYLPVDAVIMAGGRGSRLRPLTDDTPKPLLKIGDKPIIQHNVDRLQKFGVDDFWISVRYLGEQIEAFFGNGADRGISINFIWEEDPLGTIGAVSKIDEFSNDYVLITNSDLLTNLDYEDFFLDFIENDADMSVVTIPYHIDIPYAVMETSDNQVVSFKEKPTYTHLSNGGIYLVKREVLHHIPKNTFYNTTDLMQYLINDGKKLISYPIRQYWLDIGRHEDYKKAQDDIKHLDL